MSEWTKHHLLDLESLSREEIEMIRSAKTVGEKVFCEVTPHHLLLTEAICSQMGNIAKVNVSRWCADARSIVDHYRAPKTARLLHLPVPLLLHRADLVGHCEQHFSTTSRRMRSASPACFGIIAEAHKL